MTPEAIRLVREIWARFENTRVDLAHAFYGHLFRVAPISVACSATCRPGAQEEKFADMLGEIVTVLDRPYRMLPQVQLLGRRHTQYGVTASDYAPVGDALLLALEEKLGTTSRPGCTRRGGKRIRCWRRRWCGTRCGRHGLTVGRSVGPTMRVWCHPFR